MKKFQTHQGLVVPIDHSNLDTDIIIPKQYLKSIERVGFGDNLFDSWRYLDAGEPGQDHSKRRVNPDFVLNKAQYNNASILLTRSNFGCGSSREHAVWALDEYGIRVVLASSYSDIFYGNAIKNGLLPIHLSEEEIEYLFKQCYQAPNYTLSIDLKEQRIDDDTHTWSFEINAFDKECLLEGLDEIALTLQQADKIHLYEKKRQQSAPWLFIEKNSG